MSYAEFAADGLIQVQRLTYATSKDAKEALEVMRRELSMDGERPIARHDQHRSDAMIARMLRVAGLSLGISACSASSAPPVTTHEDALCYHMYYHDVEAPRTDRQGQHLSR